MINTYEELIISEIASSLSLDLTSLRWFPIIPVLPDTDCDLFQLFDLVPGLGFVFKANDGTPKFSALYGELLQAQKQSFINDIAIKNFQNTKYWLNCNSTEVPIYVPSDADFVTAVGAGSSFDFTFDSTNYPNAQIKPFPAYPSFVINQPFLYFNETAMDERFVFSLHFDKLVHIPIQSGSWFTSSAFVTAYKNKTNWQTGSAVTWDSLFGKGGALNYVTNGILAASGMTLTIQSYGNYDESTLNDLKSNQQTSVWPFYMNPENTTQDFILGDDGSITITVTTTSSEISMLAMQAISVKNLVG
ncbi:hypothetical protein NAT51_06810 [Flavobacterium amniphilum]|uniref:hypothetical protein n=1 Tax=Flavobacterium amniphilum TaxID=1834035 RepID=UPI00202A01BA|nr:hypothetical protein [Flavobacterium amniphilum]MCL9805223.1 hypothetical protein [Flavobacterium amniphilum]